MCHSPETLPHCHVRFMGESMCAVVLNSFRYPLRMEIAGVIWQFCCLFLGKLHMDFYSGCNIAHSHQQGVMVPLSPHPCWHFWSFAFLMMVTLMGGDGIFMWFQFAFPSWFWILTIFQMFIGHLYFSFWECPIHLSIYWLDDLFGNFCADGT